MISPGLLELDFPVFTEEKPAPATPVLTVEEWVAWIEEARQLQSPEALEIWLYDANSLPRGVRFEL